MLDKSWEKIMDRKNWNIGQPLWGQWTTLNAHHSSKSQTKPWCRCLDNVLPIYHLYISPDTREWQESNIVLERDTRRVIYPPHKKPSKPWSRGGGGCLTVHYLGGFFENRVLMIIMMMIMMVVVWVKVNEAGGWGVTITQGQGPRPSHRKQGRLNLCKSPFHQGGEC